MKYLPSGCRRSEIKVIPATWNTKKASTKKNWQIYYRFYQPGYKAKLVIVKLMNSLNDLKQRQEATEALIRQITFDLDQRGYNPNTGAFDLYSPNEVAYGTPFIESLWAAYSRLTAKPKTLIDIKSVINGCERAARRLVYDITPVNEIRTKHLTILLEEVGRTNPRWSPRRYNMYRAYLMKLFKELLKYEAVDLNPAANLERKIQPKRIREVLHPKLRRQVDEYLKQSDPAFHRFVHIFFHSGARETELFNLKVEDVDLPGQRFKVTIEKGRQHKEVWKTIKTMAVPLWQGLVNEATPGQYLFSVGLKPGNRKIGTDALNKRWRKVKAHFGTSVDLYSLKHLNTTEIVQRMGEQAAAAMNSHTTTGMVVSIYDVGRAERIHNWLKDADNGF